MDVSLEMGGEGLLGESRRSRSPEETPSEPRTTKVALLRGAMAGIKSLFLSNVVASRSPGAWPLHTALA